MALSLLSSVRLADVLSLAKPGQDGGTHRPCRNCSTRKSRSWPAFPTSIGRRYFNLLDKGVQWVRARSRDEP